METFIIRPYSKKDGTTSYELFNTEDKEVVQRDDNYTFLKNLKDQCEKEAA
jgi:hypothetical protein